MILVQVVELMVGLEVMSLIELLGLAILDWLSLVHRLRVLDSLLVLGRFWVTTRLLDVGNLHGGFIAGLSLVDFLLERFLLD